MEEIVFCINIRGKYLAEAFWKFEKVQILCFKLLSIKPWISVHEDAARSFS